ncbi:MAG TPA: GSU2403 family nucleotidyltransferase fold protein [Fibrobacteria bacterium]|nr:GSU2403 family nucleotidyltransferase fold protein [Fibrobacteria bacterium]
MRNEKAELDVEMFLSVLRALEESGALRELVLIGSWCLLFYKAHYGDSDLIPAVRTSDVDLLVPWPKRVRRQADVPAVLASLGFMETTSFLTGYTKFERGDLVVEFLMPLRGDGREQVVTVKPLKITTQGLRHLDYQDDELVPMSCHGFTVRVPRPELYTLFKFIVHAERKNPVKQVKDLATAQRLSDFLRKSEEGRRGLRWAYSRLTKKQQKALLAIVKDKDPLLHLHLTEA